MWTIVSSNHRQQAHFNGSSTVERMSNNSLVPSSMPGFSRLTNSNIFGTVIVAVLVIFIVAALIAPVANLTTGITISHSGFTPNANVTSTPGLTAVMQLYPLFFIFVGLLYVAKVASEETRGI